PDLQPERVFSWLADEGRQEFPADRPHAPLWPAAAPAVAPLRRGVAHIPADRSEPVDAFRPAAHAEPEDAAAGPAAGTLSPPLPDARKVRLSDASASPWAPDPPAELPACAPPFPPSRRAE